MNVLKIIRTNLPIALILIYIMSSAALAAAPNPVTIPPAGIITVDGNSAADPDGEWNTTTDFFADMHKAAKHNKDILSKLYLRYDCNNQILYAMVLLEPGEEIDEDADNDDHFIKIGGSKLVDADSGDDGTAPDFHWIIKDGDKIGWEASTPLAPGNYDDLNVHTQVDDDETSAVTGRAIDLVVTSCTPTPIPEFPTVALPIAAILGLLFYFQRKKQ